jgi:hypothetical protein
MASSPAIRLTSEHLHPVGETCPFCDQAIPNDRAEEIRARYDRKQRDDEAALKSRVEQQVSEFRAQAEADKLAAVGNAKKESAAALAQAAIDAAAREAAALENGKKAAAAEAQQKVDVLQAEQQAAKLKLQQAEQLKAAAEEQVAKLKADQDAMVKARADEARAALETAKADEINALSAKHAQDTQKLSDQMAAMQRQLEAVEAEGADIKLIDVLKKTFPKDTITAINKTQGADISHVVMHNKKPCGTILYDSRNRNQWRANFAVSLREDMVTAKAAHAILTTSKFPAGVRHVHVCEGVVVAGLARVEAIAQVLRDVMVSNYTQRVSQEGRDAKTAKLYDFIASDAFDNALDSLASNDGKLLELDEEEQRTHKKVWEKRRVLTTNSQKLHGKLRVDVDRIIGTGESE